MTAPPMAPLQSDEETSAEAIGRALFSFEFDWVVLAYHLSVLILAFFLALPVAWDREQQRASPGLRTFPLVSIASCAYVLIAVSAVGSSPDAVVRILQGLATGIGFIGGGAILKSERRVTGTATAAGIWTMGALGAAVALRRLEIALLLSVATFATLRWLKPFKTPPDEKD